MQIGFIGLGKLGKPCAEAMAEQGMTVAGYDNNMSCISKLIDIKGHTGRSSDGQGHGVHRCAHTARSRV